VVDTKLTVRNMVAQMDGLIAQPLEDPPSSPPWSIPRRHPGAEQARLREAHRAAVRDQVYPPTGGCATSSRTNICPAPATAWAWCT
jgi:hypothetical protein